MFLPKKKRKILTFLLAKGYAQKEQTFCLNSSAMDHPRYNLQKEAERIGKLYLPKFLSFARRKYISLDEDTLIDIFCDSVLVFLQKSNNGVYQEKGKLKAFLFKIAKDKAANKIKELKFKAEKKVFLRTKPEDAHHQKESTEHKKFFLGKAISQLEEEDQNIIRLFYFYNYPDAAIAKALGISSDAAKMRRHYILNKLKNILQGKKDLFL
ncbi:MAG: sigma-70 family RNA polymerase sigma factor [Lewinellaceae bacterium]|nr:sigma-70 family RNA polymerase sigma factor [Lewinellaceae bacterium]